MNARPSTPAPAFGCDILVFGTPTGVPALEAAIKAESPGLALAAETVDAQMPVADAWLYMVRAIAAHGAQAVVVASYALSLGFEDMGGAAALSDKAGVPVYLVLPPIAEAARLTCTRHVALMARPQVLGHPGVHRQLGLYAARGLKVTLVPCVDIAYMAHRHLEGRGLPDIMAMREFMAPVRLDVRIDTIIMASSLVSQLRAVLEKAAFRPFYWVDGLALAGRRCAALGADIVPAARHHN